MSHAERQRRYLDAHRDEVNARARTQRGDRREEINARRRERWLGRRDVVNAELRAIRATRASFPHRPRRFDAIAAFWAKVDTSAGLFGCWPWLGAKGGRPGLLYGMTRWNGRHSVAHRVAFILTRGEIPEGLQLDHLCRNTACVNPAHLEPVTASENMLRARAAATGEVFAR